MVLLYFAPCNVCGTQKEWYCDSQIFLFFKISVNGQWGAWSGWTGCSTTCGTGTKYRSRNCNNPAPANGGASCPGTQIEFMSCNLQVCPGKWKMFHSCLGGPGYKFGGT